MLENFIFSESKEIFIAELEAGNVPEEAVVYIEDTKEIWTHGVYFDGKQLDSSKLADKEYVDNKVNDIVGNIDSILDSIINT